MKRFDSRLEKLERHVESIFPKIKRIMVIQYAGESNEESIRLAGYPAEEENRGVIFMHFVKSLDPETGESILMTRQESIDKETHTEKINHSHSPAFLLNDNKKDNQL